MNARPAAAALGASITGFLIVAVAVIELLRVEFSALVGLPVGLLAGGAIFAVVASRYGALTTKSRYAVDAAAAFGLAVAVTLAVSYVNLAGLRSDLSVDVTVAVGVFAAILSVLVNWRT